jgi:dUTP pyrophosphatase
MKPVCEEATWELPEGELYLEIEQLPNWLREKDSVFHFGSPMSTAFDMFACIPENSEVVIEPFKRMLIPTGFKFRNFGVWRDGELLRSVSPDFQIRARSGLAYKQGICVLNGPATIDQDYRGEIMVLLANMDPENSFTVSRGDRIAQAVIGLAFRPIARREKNTSRRHPSASERGAGGFGSTGISFAARRPEPATKTCHKCHKTSGDDWSQCGGSCPMPMSPYYNKTA